MRTIWAEEEGKGNAQWLAVATRQAFDLCRRLRNYRCPHSSVHIISDDHS